MISAVAFCPHPPLLVPDLAAGAAPELAALRTACRGALRRVAAEHRGLVLLGAGPRSQRHADDARGTFAGYGVRLEVALGPKGDGPVELPLSLTVGAWLVRAALGPDAVATGYSVEAGRTDLGDVDVAGDVALLVLGDGSARRGEGAPGGPDERADAFDAGVAAALGSGEPDALGRLDGVLGDELLAAGVPAWHAAGSLLPGGRYRAELDYQGAPYGVGYFVATWTARE